MESERKVPREPAKPPELKRQNAVPNLNNATRQPREKKQNSK
jgi:hypothetical protein